MTITMLNGAVLASAPEQHQLTQRQQHQQIQLLQRVLAGKAKERMLFGMNRKADVSTSEASS